MPDAPKPHDTLSWLDLLLREERIALTRGPLLDTTPAAVHLRRDRIEGMLLGLAIGDALGNTTEGLTPGARRPSSAPSTTRATTTRSRHPGPGVRCPERAREPMRDRPGSRVHAGTGRGPTPSSVVCGG
jgi:hypothetical protein